MKIAWTRRLLHAALDGELEKTSFRLDPIFNVQVPIEVREVPSKILDPKAAWADEKAYIAQAQKLAQLFTENFKPYSSLLNEQVRKAGPFIKET